MLVLTICVVCRSPCGEFCLRGVHIATQDMIMRLMLCIVSYNHLSLLFPKQAAVDEAEQLPFVIVAFPTRVGGLGCE